VSRVPFAVLALALSACTSSFGVGEPCTASSDCRDGFSCIYANAEETEAVCMMDCVESETRLCEGGEVCIPAAEMGVPRELGVCFLGGAGAVGSSCIDTFDCELGAQCIELGSENRCYRACTVGDGSACAAGETCAEIIGMGDNGYCQPDA